ncbi:hypothetical protein NDA12_001306 [Ustilago hordei]|nr:hypothetical protein NDA12_001306 [Ustilago hordei]KAJ1574501.1 hypothetical protein NDA15_003869 [Ustilago hordei]
MSAIHDIPTVLEIQHGSRQSCDRADRLSTLILIHPGAGMSACYARLGFHADRRVIAINQTWLGGLTGVVTASEALTFQSVREAASVYLAYLEDQGWIREELNLQRKYGKPAVAFGGWSYGGCVALEMAHQVSGGNLPWRKSLLDDYTGVLLFDAVHPVGVYDLQDQTISHKHNNTQADKSILSSAPAQMQDEEMFEYLRACYKDATRLLAAYDTTHLRIRRQITLVKAGKSSPTDRSLSNGARIQRIKNQLCEHNGWKKIAQEAVQNTKSQWLTIPLPKTAHDDLFTTPHLAFTQMAIDQVESLRRI